MIEYTGIIKHVRFYSEETRFIVALFDSEQEDKPFLITGNMSYVNPDDKYRITGDFVIHPRYGKQFQIQSYEIILADDQEEIIRYLSSPLFKGIGKKQAEVIVEALGKEALMRIKEDPSCLDLIRGMSEKKKQAIVDVLMHQEYDQEVLSFFMGHGISTKNLALIQSVYQEKTLEVLQNNPYQLIDDIDGIGFKSADQLAMKLGVDPMSHHRLLAALQDSLKQLCFQSGSTYSSIDRMWRAFHRLLPIIDQDTFEECLDELLERQKIIQEGEDYFPYELHESEMTIASLFEKFSHLAKSEVEEKKAEASIHEVEEELGITYDEKQKEAIYSFLKEPAMILTGGPGTGKTTIVQAILKVYKNFYPEDRIDLVAPTGRAAKRLSELTGIEACTIHRLLKWDLHTNTFAMNQDNPIDTRMLVIDEFSMVDSLLFSKLLLAGRYISKILIIGDDEQLPSVAPGNVLKDLMHSDRVPTLCLNTIYRQEEGSGIVALAHAIRNNAYTPELFDTYRDIHFTLCESYEVVSHITAIVQQAIAQGYDANDIQVLAPMYSGVAGIDALNEALQELFNPEEVDKNELRVGRRLFREGDKILQLKNRPDDNVFNGDIGTLVEIAYKDGYEHLMDTLIVEYDGVFIEYTANDFYSITHAYCMSIHKSQGNEFKIVIMAVLKDFSIMMRKNLLYTGITRAKQSLFLLGSHNVFIKAIGLDFDERRQTKLKERLTVKSVNIADFEDNPS